VTKFTSNHQFLSSQSQINLHCFVPNL